MVCVDTDFIAALDRHDSAALEKMQELDRIGETIHTTAVNVAEAFHGAHKAENKGRKAALGDVRELLRRFSVLSLDYGSASIWGELANRLKSNSIGDMDLLIASIAIANKQTLLTRNVKHFERVPNLTVENW